MLNDIEKVAIKYVKRIKELELIIEKQREVLEDIVLKTIRFDKADGRLLYVHGKAKESLALTASSKEEK